jgi:pyruvate,water dikinase
MLSGDGGMGRMYRDFGNEPDASLATIGVYDLIAGRPFLNLSREPRMQHGDLPLRHSFDKLKANPQQAQHSTVEWQSGLAGVGFWLKLPMTFLRLRRRNRRIAEMSRSFPDQFRKEILPKFARECDEMSRLEFASMGAPELLKQFETWSRRVLVEIASHSLKPAALTDREMDDWRRTAGPAWASQFASGFLRDMRIDPRVDLAAGLQQLATGDLSTTDFVKQFGHRGPHEMELSQSRYCEAPPEPSPRTLPKPSGDSTQQILVVAKTPNIDRLREFVGLREVAKHYLMLGYHQLRRMLLEFDRRFDLNGGVFYLMPEELPRLTAGDDLSATITGRRKRWTALKSVPMPGVLFSDDLEAIGRAPATRADVARFEGHALSFGVAEGSAMVLREPTNVESDEPFVLVCPTMDPAWTPLMLRACAVVTETGGVLSHGAIVAREIGVAAVGGVLDATKRIRNGDRLRVDGGSGVVMVVDAAC